jgi:hypothetical protein
VQIFDAVEQEIEVVKQYIVIQQYRYGSDFMVNWQVKEFGPQLGEPFSKHLVNGIFELRIQQSSNITRILYFS